MRNVNTNDIKCLNEILEAVKRGEKKGKQIYNILKELHPDNYNRATVDTTPHMCAPRLKNNNLFMFSRKDEVLVNFCIDTLPGNVQIDIVTQLINQLEISLQENNM